MTNKLHDTRDQGSIRSCHIKGTNAMRLSELHGKKNLVQCHYLYKQNLCYPLNKRTTLTKILRVIQLMCN